MNGTIETTNGKLAFKPGEAIRGTVHWETDQSSIQSAELRLLYYTSGKGTRDVHTAAAQSFTSPGTSESRTFEVRVAETSPWSFSGKLISLAWALELVLDDETLAARLDVIVSPALQEIQLYAHDDGSARSGDVSRFGWRGN